MNYSLGEFEALVAKAFRGVGCTWGKTEDASFSARRLAEFGLPAGQIVMRLLESLDENLSCSSTDHGSPRPALSQEISGPALCSVCVGTAIADRGGCDRLDIAMVEAPEMVGPLLMETLTADASTDYTIEWEGGGLEISNSQLLTWGEPASGGVAVHLRRRSRTQQRRDGREVSSRIDVDPRTISELERFAHRTYAPATAESRAAGAGGRDD